MSDDWDFYFARVDDAVSSIFVDLGVRPEVPMEKRPWLLWVWIEMQTPRPDGLSSSDEAPRLQAIGDALDSMISVTCGAQLVGRVTGGDRREFYFYANEPGELEGAAARAMKEFETYKYEIGSAFQPDWDHYVNLLYPSDSNLQRMYNRRVLEELAAEGDVHEQPRKVDHVLHFSTDEARQHCRETLMAIDFAVEFESLSEEEGDDLPYQLGVSRVDSVDSHTINGISLELARLAVQNQGEYDGWSCEVMQQAGGSS